MKNFLFAIASISLLSCSQHMETSTNNIKNYYDYEVLYTYQGKNVFENDKYRNRLSWDSLYIIIEESFVSDTLKIKSKNNILINNVIQTKKSTGTAATYVFKHDMKTINISLNHSPWICIDVSKKEYNIIGIRKSINKIKVLFYKKVPLFE